MKKEHGPIGDSDQPPFEGRRPLAMPDIRPADLVPDIVQSPIIENNDQDETIPMTAVTVSTSFLIFILASRIGGHNT